MGVKLFESSIQRFQFACGYGSMSIFRMRYQSGVASRIGKIHLSNWTNRISIESLIGILIGESQNGFVISIQLLLMDFGLCFLMLALKLLVASCYFASCDCQKETESNILKSWLHQRMYGIGGRTLERTKWKHTIRLRTTQANQMDNATHAISIMFVS